MAALVRACYGMREAAMRLGVPLVSGKDSMKNDYRGRWLGKQVQISVPPTLLMTAVAKVTDVALCRSADFKQPGDPIYLLGARTWGGKRAGLGGSQLEAIAEFDFDVSLPEPDWDSALQAYKWLGSAIGKERAKIASIHDISDGGVLAAVSEGLLARGYGALIQVPSSEAKTEHDVWNFAFGEGFHGFVVSAMEMNAIFLENEWNALQIPYMRLGSVTTTPHLELRIGSQKVLSVETKLLRQAWKREGYWE
jgi:phosphoribosylformylglycinamidine synthase